MSSLRKLLRVFHHGALFVVGLVDGHENDLEGREPRGKDEALIVAVNHDDGAHKARREAPGGGPAMLEHAGFIEVADFERLGEILPEIYATCRPAAPFRRHHGFDGVGLFGRRRSVRNRT